MQQEELDFDWDNESGLHARRAAALPGDIVFASVEEQSQRSAELLGAGALLVTLPAPTAEARGRLGEILEELVERELARMGAPSPYLAAWAAMPEDAQARLADQLFRARTVGATGLAIAMGSLAAIATPVLTTDDSATLRWLAETTADAPLVLLVDDADLGLAAYPAPMPLSRLLPSRKVTSWAPAASGTRLVAARVADVEVEVEVEVEVALESAPSAADAAFESEASEREASEGEVEPAIELRGDDATTNDTRVSSIDAVDAILDAAPLSVSPQRIVNVGLELDLTVLTPAETVAPEPEPVVEPTHASPEVVAAPEVAAAPEVVAPEPVGEPVGEAVAVVAPEPVVPAVTDRARSIRRDRTAPEKRPVKTVTAGIPVSGPNDAWRSWAIALTAARGAQPLAAFERLFTESYVPLANAVAAGLDDPRALRAYEEFRRSFERSYTDAFTAFGATNRRPRLVMDAYDLASKQARLSNARSAHVLVVDSMRYDLGCLVRDALARESTGVATLTSETLLWSALPTTSTRQIETFARGLDALRAPAREEPSESLRGRAAEVVRRLRVGSRELYKLDLVPSMLEASGDVIGSLESIAASCAESIARHISTLQPRTLLYIVGDHGFSVDKRGAVQTGGASPEEVLVPAFAWLIGELH